MPVGLRGRMIGNAAPVRPVLPAHQQLSTNTQYDTCVDIQFPADILCYFVRWLRFPRHNSADTRRADIKHCRKSSLSQVHFIHSQFHHIGERWSANSEMFLGVVSHEVRQQFKLDEICIIFRRIVVYQRKQLFNSINGPIVLGFVLNLCQTCPTFICSDNLSCRIPYTSLWIGYIQTEL